MNVVTPLHTAIPFGNPNLNTDSVRRDNQLKETIPQPSQSQNSAAESGLGSDSDKVRQPGQQPLPVVYEKPQTQQPSVSGGQEGFADKDNGQDESAGKENAEQQQQQQAEREEVEQLEKRDTEVRAHEQAHASTGGQYAGAPSYEFEKGPDGQQYAVGGEVSIDISAESDPQDTLRKMRQVEAAALAPADPSPTDLRVAAEARQKANDARQDLAEQQQERVEARFDQVFGEEQASGQQIGPDLEDIVVGGSADSPVRRLDESDPVAVAGGAEVSLEETRISDSRHLKEDADPVAQASGAEVTLESPVPDLSERDASVNRFAKVIEQRYNDSYQLAESRVQLSA